MNQPYFFTTGCAGRQLADLPALVEQQDAVIADIRFSVDADSPCQAFVLQTLLGRKYRRVTQLGARKNKNGDQTIQHLALGLRVILSWRINVILLCECERFERCHRSIIARELSRQNFAVEELKDWQTQRQSPLTNLHEGAETARAGSGRILLEKNNQNDSTRARVESTAHLEPGAIKLSCGDSENVQIKIVAGLIADGLGIHPDKAGQQQHSITHLATGRKVCTAHTLAQAKLMLDQLLKLNADWKQTVPWRNEAEAHRLKNSIKNIVFKADKD